jgi:hypothetical protein
MPLLTCADFERALELAASAVEEAPPKVVFSPHSANVRATNVGITVDEDWLSKYFEPLDVEDRWPALVGVAAHELGHYRPEGRVRDPIQAELFADRFSGHILRKLGFSTKPLHQVLRSLKKTPDHPPAEDRVGAVGARRDTVP